MKISIDTERRTMRVDSDGGTAELDLYGREAFTALSDVWLKAAWTLKYTYSFSWLGRPIIQLPEDMFRAQEVLYRVKPDVLVETGVAHGGSLVFYASLFKAIGKGHVVGVDIEIRPHNRTAIEAHELKPLITLVEGSSVDESTLARVRSSIKPGDRVMVVLDSNHTKAHVAAELRAYAPLVSVGSYIVVTDGYMESLHDVPRGRPEWLHDNPKAAAEEFVAANPSFVFEEPAFPFNESPLTERITHWPAAFIKRVA